MASKDRFVSITNCTRGTVLAVNARVADTFLSRAVGLLGAPPLVPGDGLLLKPCSSIHMFGMKFSLDAVFFDSSWQVVGLVEGLAPGQLSRFFPRAASCLELPAGTIAQTGTHIGDRAELGDPAV